MNDRAEATDNSRIHDVCRPMEHLVDLFCFNGRPFNKDTDPDHAVTILINHGYVVGFSSYRKQPLWAAYRVAEADQDVDYDRPQLFYDDERLGAEDRVGPKPFGKIDVGGREVPLNRGHLVPNEAINRQFGRLAQMETFFMSNMSPQYARMNQGIWAQLESRILNDYAPAMDHVWVMVGPIFDNDPPMVERAGALRIPVPRSYYCILFDPIRYPYGRMSNVEVLALEIPQTAGREELSHRHITTIDAIERKTELDFLTSVPNRSEAKTEALTADGIWAPSPRRARRVLEVEPDQ